MLCPRINIAVLFNVLENVNDGHGSSWKVFEVQDCRVARNFDNDFFVSDQFSLLYEMWQRFAF